VIVADGGLAVSMLWRKPTIKNAVKIGKTNQVALAINRVGESSASTCPVPQHLCNYGGVEAQLAAQPEEFEFVVGDPAPQSAL
jgi:hypothetical protein